MAAKKSKGLIKIGEVMSYRPTAAGKDENLIKDIINFSNKKINTTALTRNDLLTKGLEMLMKAENGSLEEKLEIVGITIFDILELFNAAKNSDDRDCKENKKNINKVKKNNNFGDGLIMSIPRQGIKK